jgi:nucleoside-diphosphate-sugar epimerase
MHNNKFAVSVSLFVTGGSGYLGSCFLGRINASMFDKIYCLVRDRVPVVRIPNVEFVRGDLTSPASYRDALSRCETVVHIAALTGKSRKQDYFRANAEGTASLVEAAAATGLRKFLYVSTIAVKFSDQRRYYYAISKSKAEEVVRGSGLRYTIVRPTMIFGKRAPVLEGLTRLAAAAVTPVFGDGRTLVQPVFVDDVASLVASTIENGIFENGVVEIGGPDVIAIEALLRKISAFLKRPAPRIIHLPAGPVAAVLAALERVALPLLPFTAGQLASFTNAGTAASSATTGLDEMLARSLS